MMGGKGAARQRAGRPGAVRTVPGSPASRQTAIRRPSTSPQFTFRQNLSDPLDVEVKIYTIAGRLIQSLHTITAGEPMVRVPWDGRDRDGDAIANGVYLYKLVVRTTDGRFSSEALGKMTVVR